jgi:23S rRNA pseudouridine2604 synthase
MPESTKDLYPMRINKYLAHGRVATRREADKLVEKKRVFINGHLAVLGSKVGEGDKVEVRGGKQTKQYKYFAYNKPIDVITHSPQGGEQDIRENIRGANLGKDVFPLGRLDKNSHGLMILTNDGRITEELLSPEYAHEREYVVRTTGPLRSSFKEKMEAGVNIEGYVTKECKVKILGKDTFKVILTEGKKHQIRRMCSALFQEVADLKRERIMNITLGSLAKGGHREIKGKELDIFLGSLGMAPGKG